MLKILTCCVAFSWLATQSIAQAQGLSRITVFSETDDQDNIRCEARHTSATAAVEAAMRYNDIEVEQAAPVDAYINIVALQTDAGCAVSLTLQFRAFMIVPNIPTLGTRWAWAELCEKGTLLTGPSYNMQSRINDVFRDLADQCVSKISKDQ